MHRRTFRVGFWLTALVTLLSGFVLAAEALPPPPTRFVNDYASIIDPTRAEQLNARLAAYERETSNQILVAIFPRLPENTFLEDFTVKTAQAWGVGGKQRDNGIVFFAFISDRKMRIEVGYGLEGRVPDSVAAAIISNEIRPAFKAGNFTLGAERGVEALIAATRGEYTGTGKTIAETRAGTTGSIPVWIIIAFIIAFLIWIHMGDTMFQRGGRSIVYTGLDIARVILLSSGSGGRGGGDSSGGFSGGGGGSFDGGGGSFGGGGASGDW